MPFVTPLRNPRIQNHWIPPGDAGIYATCAKMRELIRHGQADAVIRELACDIASHARSNGEIMPAIALWCATQVRFRPDDFIVEKDHRLYWAGRNSTDFNPVEILHTARQIAAQGYGDCDDYCVLGGALFVICGFPIRLVIIATSPRKPRRFSHVYLHVRGAGGWVPCDPVNTANPIGWEFPNPARKRLLHV